MKRIWIWFVTKASIRKKLIISFAILVSIPMTVLGLYAYKQSEKYMINQTMETMENNLNRLTGEFNGIFQRETDFTKFLAYNLDFRKGLESNPFNHVAIAQLMNEYVEPILWYFIASDTYMKGIHIYTPYITHNVGSFLQPDTMIKEEMWYQRHKSNFKTVWSLEEGSLFATRTIIDSMSTIRPIAVFRAEYFLNTILEPAESLDFLGNGIIILDTDKNTVYQKMSSNVQIDQLVIKRIQNLEEQQVEDNSYILLSSKIEVCDFTIYYYIDKNMITRQATPILYSTLTMLGICLIVVIIFIYLLSGILSSRILMLKSKAEQIASGELKEKEFVSDLDEIGVVTNSLMDMAVQLEHTIQEVYVSNLEKRAAQLKALQAMINPHFLYNSLSAIKWKALRQGNDDISEITGLLAKFYRTSLNEGKQMTTVANELENIKAYIEIQKLTHENSFDTQFLIDETGSHYEVLNFLLQPIVENAIKHGVECIEEETEKGLIIVEFIQNENFLLFHVMNNGPTIELQAIDAIMNKPSKGYGILNIKQRIALFYGGDSGLTVSITPQGYTCFTLKIAKNIIS